MERVAFEERLDAEAGEDAQRERLPRRRSPRGQAELQATTLNVDSTEEEETTSKSLSLELLTTPAALSPSQPPPGPTTTVVTTTTKATASPFAPVGCTRVVSFHEYAAKWKGVPGHPGPPPLADLVGVSLVGGGGGGGEGGGIGSERLSYDQPSHLHQGTSLLAALGAFLSIGTLSLVHYIGSPGSDFTMVLGSFGASAVLMFGAPEVRLSSFFFLLSSSVVPARGRLHSYGRKARARGS